MLDEQRERASGCQLVRCVGLETPWAKSFCPYRQGVLLLGTWQLSQKSPFSYSISHIGITSILIPSRSKVSRWEEVMIFPCLQPVTEEAAIKPPISRSTLSSFNVQQTCISSATRSPFFTTKSHSFDS